MYQSEVEKNLLRWNGKKAETIDKLRAENAALKAQIAKLDWSALTAENPAQIGDEVARFRDGHIGAYHLLDQWDGKTYPSPSEAAKYTHRRPINAPAAPEAQS